MRRLFPLLLLPACLVDPTAWSDRRAALDCAGDWFVDADGDGWGDAPATCGAAGAVETAGDCDDAAPTVHPEAEEIPADGVDEDCDGGELCFEDGDGDGYGLNRTVEGGLACDAPGQSTRSDDCDDRSQAVSPGADEIPCNSVDDDCDPLTLDVQEEVPGDGVDQDCDNLEACYEDIDGDGYGSATVQSLDLFCAIDGLAALGGDCDEGSGDVNPGASEVCNRIDDDCDHLVDDADPDVDPAGFQYVVADYDHDGFGNATESTMACYPPPGNNRLDCDDDDPLATIEQGWSLDEDGDLAGDGENVVTQCENPGGGLAPERNGVDCEPRDPDIYPLQIEDCGDEVDQDCDGLVDCADEDCHSDPRCLPPCADRGWAPASLPASINGTTAGAGKDETGICGGAQAPDVAVWFTSPVSGRVNFVLTSTAYDTILHAKTACGGAPLGCNDDAVALQSAISIDNVVAGVPFLVIADGWGAQAGPFTLRAQ